MRSEQQIVMEANKLARDFYGLLGHEVKRGHRFDQARHPQEQICWRMACHAFLELQQTDVEDALAATT
jgi:hypothetical protein